MRSRNGLVVRTLAASVMLTAVVMLAVFGCSTPLPLRGDGEVSSFDLARLNPDEGYIVANRASVERHTTNGGHNGYVLATIEFPSGQPPREFQIKRALQLIEDGERDLTVVTFVHGWDHTADARDPHVVAFRATLDRLSRDIRRPLLGIYVSWPAKPLRGPLNKLTFLDRSRAAHHLSLSCAVRSTFTQLHDAVADRRRRLKDSSTLIIVGHSLGGKFLFTPVEEALEGGDGRKYADGDCKPMTPVQSLKDLRLWGDIIVLVNPAQDVNDYRAFNAFNERNVSANGPVLVIISSESDAVIGRLFRFARTIRSLWPTHWWEFNVERIGLGWRRSDITHRLCFGPAAAWQYLPSVKDPICRETWEIRSRTSYGDFDLESRSENTKPFVVIRTDGNILKGHSGMFDSNFIRFLLPFLTERVHALTADP
jgi:hypothetical protein